MIKRLAVLLLFVLVMPACSNNSSNNADADADEAAIRNLVDLERKVIAAALALDFDTLDEIYAEDFVNTHTSGVVDTKASWIETLKEIQRTGNGRYTALRVAPIEVEMHGSIAITSGRVHAKSESNNPRWQEYTIWYVRVYEMQDGHWRLLSHRSIREESGPLAD